MDEVEEMPFDSGDGSRPTFELELAPTYEAYEAETLELECRVRGTPKPSVIWLRDGRTVRDDADSRYTVEADGLHRLTLRELFPENAGQYQALARNAFGKARSDASVILLEGKRGAPAWLEPLPKTLQVHEGDAFELSARVRAADASARFEWSVNGERVDASDTHFSQRSDRSASTLRSRRASMEKDNNAVVRLRCLTAKGECESECRVTVLPSSDAKNLVPPYFVRPLPVRRKLKEGEALQQLEVEFGGTPLPDVEWYRNGRLVQGVMESEGKAALKLSAVVEESGCYEAVLVSRAGEESCRCQIDVEAKDGGADKGEGHAPHFTRKFHDCEVAEG